MKYKRFEELPVWQAAIEFAMKIFEFTEAAATEFKGLGDTRNQLELATLSISNNIAEGFERGTTTELINFLYIARGSSGESRSILCFCERLPKFVHFKSDISNLKLRAEGVSKQLHGWIESLKNSEIKGVKFLTEKERKRLNEIKADKEFKELLQKVVSREQIDWDKI